MVEMEDGRFAHASGAMWLANGTLLIADAHLGYGWAMRRRGQLGPVRDHDAVAKLRSVVAELEPSGIVFLGDLVHAPRPSPEEHALLEEAILWLAARVPLTLVEGNHDRGFVRDFGHLPVRVVREWVEGSLRAVHGDRPEQSAMIGHRVSGHTVIGHFHPAISVRDAAGARHKLPAFLFNRNYTVLPAFSPFAAGADLRKGVAGELAGLFPEGVAEVIGVSGRRVSPAKRLRIGAKKQTASG